MNQKELIDAIAYHSSNVGVTKGAIKFVLEMTGIIVQDEMQKGEGSEVTLPGIGKISIKQSPARIGRNPATGAEVHIPAKNKPYFRAAKAGTGSV
jgi:DNA-binding protein HU-beta